MKEDLKSVFIGVLIVIGLIVLLLSKRTDDVVDPRPDIVNHDKKVEKLDKTIDELIIDIDDSTHIRIDSILKEDYEGVEDCIDTVVINGVSELVWNGCK